MTLLLALLGLMTAAAGPVCPVRGDDTDIEAWVDTHFGRRAVPPFSFKLDGVPSAKLLKRWAWSREPMNAGDPACRAARFVWRRRDGFEVRCEVKAWPEQKVVEWVVRFHNGADVESGQLTDVLAADLSLRFPAKGPFQLHYAEGNKISRADYAPRTKELQTGEAAAFMPAGGRSSAEAFPFYNLESPASGQGAVVAVGWTGTWTAAFCKEDDRQVTFRTGMAGTDLFLHPGEEIRTPSAAFLLWSGARMDGHNRLRRFLLEHHGRKVNGQPVRNLLSSGFNYRDPQPYGEYSAITARWAVAMVERYRQFGLQPDIFWMDAGWHEGAADWQEGRSWATTTGNWTVDRRRFPDGMKPVSDAVHRAGAKFMLWFEPERAFRGSEIWREHDEYLIHGAPEDGNALFYLGDPEALRWITDRVDSIIKEYRVKFYRQDFNFSPAGYWQAGEAANRRGIHENLHIQGYYAFWDELLRRNPGLHIDSCAGGGRRNDIETMKRAVPLHYTDIGYGHHPIKQKQHRQMFEWIPYFRAHNMSWDEPDGTYGGTGRPVDEFAYQCALAPAVTSMTEWNGPENEFELGRAFIPVWRRCAEIMLRADYYPLTETNADASSWYAMQFFDPERGDGFAQIIRNVLCGESRFVLKGYVPDECLGRIYKFTEPLSGRTWTMSGSNFRNGGFEISLPERTGEIWFYCIL